MITLKTEIASPKDSGTYSLVLSATEIGLGSLLHAFHVPLAGHFLSLNQGLILTVATHETSGRREAVGTANTISSISALLKLLSPLGKRLTPMLAISTQGLLYSLGVFVFGANLIGVCFGMLLLSLWGFLQPLILAELIFGQTLWLALETTWKKIAEGFSIPVEYGLWILFAGVAIKLVLAIAVGIIAWLFRDRITENYLSRLSKLGESMPKPVQRSVSPLRGSFKDLFQPWFLIGLILSVGFLYLNPVTSGFTILLYILRTLALGWIVFWLIRAFPLAWIIPILRHFPRLEKTFLQLRGDTERVSSRTFRS